VNELEQRLVALGEAIEYPATPSFDLDFEPRPETASRWRRRAAVLALAVALVLVLVGGVLALSADARSAFLEIFRIRGAVVERVETLPEVDVSVADFGERVSRADAERRVGFELVELGSPDAIFVRDDLFVSLVYGPTNRPKLVLTQSRGAVWDGFVKKIAGSGTTVQTVEVNGEPGLFVSGDAHVVMFVDGTGAVRDDQVFLAGNTLLWNRGPLLLRLEAGVTLAEALALARSVG
jgi:hypothetical protein